MRHALILFTLAAAFACPGCRSSSTAPSARELAVLEAELVQVNPRVVGAGASRALEFDLHNQTDRPLARSFTVDWFDARGGHVPLSSTAWLRVEVAARAFQSVRVAPMPVEARSWRLRFSSKEQ
jgi:uncharacterized protein YcfL